MGTAGSRAVGVGLCVVSLVAASSGLAFQMRQEKSRFDALVIENPAASLDVATLPVESLPAAHPLRAGWDAFRAAYGTGLRVVLDRRSGTPLVVEGQGIPWIAGSGNELSDPAPPTLVSLEASLRRFVAANRSLLLAADADLVLDADASGRLTPDLWQVVFDRVVSGVPVAGERYVFTIGHGNLISFGAPRWSRIDIDPVPSLAPAEALRLLYRYLGLAGTEEIRVVEPGTLWLIALRAPDAGAVPYDGPPGAGHASALAWRITLRVDGEPGLWVGLVDAHTGGVLAFYDDARYAQVKGGVYPETDDGICPSGCEQPNYPMPSVNVTVGGSPATTNAMGLFDCLPGGATATTALSGPYVRVSDTCGAVNESVTCDADLDLRTSAGTDCAVPAGSSPGNTHAARSSLYHLNRAKEHARAWLPSNTWLGQQLTDNVNINATCNAYWDGTVNMYRSGGGCNNTGENAGVVQHEWGHGMDQNDGGGYDNPSEAYADISEFLFDHTSCIGRGFFQSGNCGGYGNACLDCSGIRDMDWDRRVEHTPSTPANFAQDNCGGGSGPCGREVHCEGYIGGETLWDLATRDLPAAGLDAATAWQLADRLWYISRAGSGGNAYNCSLPNSDGCAATSWFSKLRSVDDDDGNLSNGTPHGAAIFAAFDRHAIACGSAADPSNQSSSSCPALGAPTLSATAASSSVTLSWTAVPDAASYRILRNDVDCSYAFAVVATVAAPATSYNDTGLANGFTEHYRVQAVGANSACDGPVSSCQAATPQPFAGTIALDQAAYACSATILVSVTDANIGAPTTTATIASTTETSPETITLTEVSPGSATYTGAIATTAGPQGGDGLLSLSHGDTVTARYVDADDGQGGMNLTREATATGDCVPPVISNVQAVDVTGNAARITWTTDEGSTSVVHYGTAPPPDSTTSSAARVTSHSVPLGGLAECTGYAYSVESVDAPGNGALDDAGGAYYGFATGRNVQPDYVSADTPVTIPDNDPVGATSTIVVPDGKTVQDVNVTLSITHTYDADLTLYLITPTGTQITLADRRGGSADNFIDTVFDDEAATPIASGTPPFTGSFRPDTPLSAADGINSAGAWKLKVVDSAGIDIGTIDTWTLTLTFPPGACGPHAVYESHALVADSCATGGAGAADGIWDPGEQIQFGLKITNDGTTSLTGVAAVLTALTPGVTVVDSAADFPDLAAGDSADSLAPHFSVLLPASLACGDSTAFQVDISASEGAWSGSFGQVVGQPLSGSGTAIEEGFSAGFPPSWTIVDGGSGGGSAATWTTSNPGGRSISPPLASPIAIVDSDYAGTSATQDEELITPVMDLSQALTATLRFDQFFRWYSGGEDEVADVDVRSSLTGGAWVNVLRQQGASSPDPDARTTDITAQAAGASDAQVRFHFYNGVYEWYWEVDNVRVDFTAPAGCNTTVCSGPPPAPRPVPDGTFGSAITASRADGEGSMIELSWDAATCPAAGYHILYGDLATVSSYELDGGVCGIGTSGSYTWTGVPAGNLWFVLAGDNGAGTESTWGTDSSGAHRKGATPSGLCGNTDRDNAPSCP
jgi:subtilisin-like proprotein convertase family protein